MTVTDADCRKAHEILRYPTPGNPPLVDRIAAALAQEREAEREAILALCNERSEAYRLTRAPGWHEVIHEMEQISAAIRARKESPK